MWTCLRSASTVAGPWWAGNLIDHTEWADDLWEWSPTLMVYPTTWGKQPE